MSVWNGERNSEVTVPRSGRAGAWARRAGRGSAGGTSRHEANLAIAAVRGDVLSVHARLQTAGPRGGIPNVCVALLTALAARGAALRATRVDQAVKGVSVIWRRLVCFSHPLTCRRRHRCTTAIAVIRGGRHGFARHHKADGRKAAAARNSAAVHGGVRCPDRWAALEAHLTS